MPLLTSSGYSPRRALGLVTGAGEAAALTLRLLFGPWADRSGRYWSLTIIGYGTTAVCVPLMAVAPFVGSAGLALAATMILAERTGKAIRSPSKSALLAHAARAVGRGRGFGVHKALDQIGSFAGPLVVAGLIALSARTWVGLAPLAVPGAVAMALLFWIRHRVPDLSVYDPPVDPPVDPPTGPPPDPEGSGPAPEAAYDARGRAVVRELPLDFQLFALACAASTLGLMTFGVISFHLVDDRLLAVSAVPLVYAAAMAVQAVSALATGFAYDRVGPRVLLVLPALVALVPALAFAPTFGVALGGVLVWGAATGIQDSTVKALVADLVPAGRLATAYGVFAALQGVAALAGGGLAGWLYDDGVADLVIVVGAAQLVAFALLVKVLRDARG